MYINWLIDEYHYSYSLITFLKSQFHLRYVVWWLYSKCLKFAIFCSILLRIDTLFFMMCDYSCCQCAPPPTAWPWSTGTQRHSSLWNTSTPGWMTRQTRALWTSPVCTMNRINRSFCVLTLIIWQDDLL